MAFEFGFDNTKDFEGTMTGDYVKLYYATPKQLNDVIYKNLTDFEIKTIKRRDHDFHRYYENCYKVSNSPIGLEGEEELLRKIHNVSFCHECQIKCHFNTGVFIHELTDEGFDAIYGGYVRYTKRTGWMA